ncbi:sushi domain-containing protein 2 isoform X2 [Mastacembelus armatus]|uniref:sushi domain-containing protein 2 isoform X2 n=1 Tax=Mastacembelus armatus TaxID=205130 RepID=UPI000E45A165|nr:sushi domain-containing protein 2-like isoform X2 [Mastacembelus armatus]
MITRSPSAQGVISFFKINMKTTLSNFLCGLFLICSYKTAGQTCRSKCGDVLDKCSCHATCVSLLNCCADYSQTCFQVKPESSSMLGGRALRILGLVLHPAGRLLCRFKGKIETEGFIDAQGHAYCVSPLLYETGWILINVSVDGINFDRSGEYFSVHPSKADPAFEVILVNSTQWHHYGTPDITGQLRLTWNSSLIGAEKVNIELWGYREFNSSTGEEINGSYSVRAELSYLYSLGRHLPNTGSFSIIPVPSEDYSRWELGNIRITASSNSDGSRDVQALWSDIHVLAWHFEQTFRNDSAAWATKKCLQWNITEKKLPNFLNELIDCPCTLAQARADSGRFHTDYGCDIEKGSVCTYHPASVHCVRSIQASPTHGSGQQCCYDSAGALMLTGDSIGGSTPDRAHDWGSPPYREPPWVPGYSHWLYDVMSFFYCCLWSDHCHIYFSHRPSSDCRKYQPPRAGVVLGDPHFITFDGLNYTFNGKGEYWLVFSPDAELSVQARTEQVKLENGTLVKATQLSSVAMKEKSSDVIEVRLAQGHLEVLRNQKLLSFMEQRWMDLHGVFVFAPSPQDVTAMFLSGVGVEVHVHEGAMAVTVLLPAEFTNHTRGLLGLMNADPSDDLLTQAGEVFSPASATPKEIFAFGTSWNISENSSHFTYDSKYLLDTYSFRPNHDAAFVPAFFLPEIPDDPLMEDMLKICFGEGAQFCKYDTLTTRSLTVGNATLRAYRNHQALMASLEPVVSCGWLPTPRNGRKNGTHYVKGNTLNFSCNDGYKLYGTAQRTCLDDGTWTGEQPYCITDDRVGFVLGSVGSLSALVTMGAMIKLHNRKQDS